MRRISLIVAIAVGLVLTHASRARAFYAPPFVRFGIALRHLAANFSASGAVDVMDLSTGLSIGYNENEPMPAASTIKVPVMVEVFRQLENQTFDLQRRVTLLESDKDYGSGDLCYAPAGSEYTVEQLLAKMIDISDNTAANMLIRLVGRRNINLEMRRLGLRHTFLDGEIRTDDWSIRQTLVTSPRDMVHLLALMARRDLIDEWSSSEMISILEGDQINTLLPEPLPPDVPIAHKTGSLDDTLDDVGIVYEPDAPYVIAVMTTHLPSLGMGRTFIHALSRLAFADEARFARWRSIAGIATFDATTATISPDVRYWEHSAGTDTNTASGG
jgi:beta-lactamase class A